VNRFLVITLLGGAACAGQQPQVLTPVRLDSAATAAATATPVASSAAATPAQPVVRTTMDDPIARVDRMDWPGPNTFRSTTGSSAPTTPSPSPSTPRSSA